MKLSEINTIPTFIFIDGSYFCFYRYHSLLNWWKNAYPEETDVLQNPYQNDKFVDKFKKTFIDNIQKIPKNLKLDKSINPIIIVGKDCKREHIWRNQLFQNYKANRLQNDGFMGGPFFKMVYDDNLFIEYLNGLYVNKLANYFPNVVRTIGLFEIDDKHHKEYSQDNINLKYINKINMDKKTLDEKPDDILKYLNCSNSNKHYFISKCNCFCFNFF